MKKSIYIILVFALAVTACGGDNSDAAEKRKELQEARKEYQSLKEKIAKLETDLKEIDPDYAQESHKAILVSTITAKKNPFEHKVDVRGAVASRKNVLISGQVPGVIQNVHVVEGQEVNKGQLLVSLDAQIIKSSINELNSALELANTLNEKQTRLWEQKIGTEVQYLQAKNNKESIESKLATAQAQLNQAIIRAPFKGIVDEVQARQGEMSSPGMPLVRITSPDDMYIQADVSERYVGKVVTGDKVEVYFPVQDKRLISSISSVSSVINAENRTFRVEVKLPKTEAVLKPNQVTILEIIDYVNPEAIALPTRLILRDDQGEYVYAIAKNNNNNVATKVRVKSGLSYNGQTEILEGLKGSEELVDKGFRDITEGVEVAIAANEETKKVSNIN
ncbi:MAG: efflux RND transporter periplasmic adaptor subunit [Bacteroidota bacterium]|nr:efflux RND transporter periplasmic adaptor subunit [Bacteroidota bacterium]